VFGVLWLALFHRDHAGLTPIFQHQLPVFDGLNLHVGAAAAACQREALPRLVVLIVAHDQRTPSERPANAQRTPSERPAVKYPTFLPNSAMRKAATRENKHLHLF